MPKFPVNNGLINLNFFHKKAKKLLQQMKAGQASEQRLLLEQTHPHADITLASAQWLVANELGFSSWPKLKAHVDTVLFAANNPNFSADNESQTTHWRCGHDIEHKLRVAGFTGAFVPFTDPFALVPSLLCLLISIVRYELIHLANIFLSHLRKLPSNLIKNTMLYLS
ncbi:hypothetical protein [Providencia rettgeri]|uniref:hypothetical protein n=1 Tax=Providencia rettgeri TaxID=587 RepID=UPI00384BC77F